MPSPSIKPAVKADCSGCAALLLEQLREHNLPADPASLRAVVKQMVGNPAHGFILVAKSEGNIVGVAFVSIVLSIEHAGNVAWLEELYVTPAMRAQGIGASLVAALLKKARADGIKAVDLEIDAGHARVASLYRRYGFQPLPRARWFKPL